MAACPKCFKEKPALAPKCHHCNSDTSIGEHVQFGVVSTVAQIAVIVIVLMLIFG
jgi:uncharacterized protein (DUF983 family)